MQTITINCEINDLQFNPNGERDILSRLIGIVFFKQVDSQQMYSMRIINRKTKIEGFLTNRKDTLVYHILFCGNVDEDQKPFLKNGTKIRMQAKYEFFKNIFWAYKIQIFMPNKKKDGQKDWVDLELLPDSKDANK